MYFMVQIKVQITRGVNPGAINPEITTALPKKAGVFINLRRPALGEVLTSPSAGRHARIHANSNLLISFF